MPIVKYIMKESWLNVHFHPLYEEIKKVLLEQANPRRATALLNYFSPFPYLTHVGVTSPDSDKIVHPKMLMILDLHDFSKDQEDDIKSRWIEKLEEMEEFEDLKQRPRWKKGGIETKVVNGELDGKAKDNVQYILEVDRNHILFCRQLLFSNVLDEKRLAIITLRNLVSKRGKGRKAWVHILNEPILRELSLDLFKNLESDVLMGSVADWATCDLLSSTLGQLLAKDWDGRDDLMKIVKNWRFGGIQPDKYLEVVGKSNKNINSNSKNSKNTKSIKNTKSTKSSKTSKDNSANIDHPQVEASEPNLWIQRVACVSLLRAARVKKYHDDLFLIADFVVKNQSRFAQLGVGWMIRETSVTDLRRTVQFITDTYDYWTREGLRYAIEKMSYNLRQKILKYDGTMEIDELLEGETEGNARSLTNRKKIEKSNTTKSLKKKNSNDSTDEVDIEDEDEEVEDESVEEEDRVNDITTKRITRSQAKKESKNLKDSLRKRGSSVTKPTKRRKLDSL